MEIPDRKDLGEVVEGGNIQSLRESRCLQKGSREESRLATGAAVSEGPLEL